MRFLLDTHTFIWFIRDDPQLSITAKTLIEDSTNILYLSSASVWEMAIKTSLGKLDSPPSFADAVNQQLNENNILLLDIRVEHAGRVATLPFHHRDPFDRLIIAQSLSDDLPIIGKDEVFDAYGVKRYWD